MLSKLICRPRSKFSTSSPCLSAERAVACRATQYTPSLPRLMIPCMERMTSGLPSSVVKSAASSSCLARSAFLVTTVQGRPFGTFGSTMSANMLRKRHGGQ